MTRHGRHAMLCGLLLTAALGVPAGAGRALAAGEHTRPPRPHSRALSHRHARSSSPVTLHVAVGYQNIYRGSAWTPIRITLHNAGADDQRGTLAIPQAAESSAVGAQAAFHARYEAPTVVPAGATRNLTVYVPGAGIQSQTTVTFSQGNKVVASASASPIGVDSSALLIAVLTAAPSDARWVGPSIERQVTTHVSYLTDATLDPVAAALATFDLIVVADADTAQLDQAQVRALESYVNNGGSLLLVGGPDWQQTLRPLHAVLLPGRLSGLRVVPNLSGLLPLATTHGSGTGGRTAISVLTGSAGTTLASQAGTPLVVRANRGKGSVEYLAFDPSLVAVRSGSLMPGTLQHLIAMAAPLAIARTWSPGGFRARFQSIARSQALTAELANLPPATVPLLRLFALLTFAYILLLGPANFLFLRLLRRQHLAWVTIPLLTAGYAVSIMGISSQARAASSTINTVGLVILNRAGEPAPATIYAGLATPSSGTVALRYGSSALPAALPAINLPPGFSFRGASTLQPTPLGMRLQEASPTTATLLSMRPWTMRDLTLDTSVPVPGAVHDALRIDQQGFIVGNVSNDTNLDLVDPVILAGQTVSRVGNLPSGATVQVRVKPAVGLYSGGGTPAWQQMYGGSAPFNTGDFGGFRDCCAQVTLPQESDLIARLRNAVAMLSQARPDALSALGNVLLVGWSERPLGTFTVDGGVPQRRDLTLVAAPLDVQFPQRGSFVLRPGTFGPHVVDVLPRAPQSTGGFGFGGNEQPAGISVGVGGFLSFEYDLPMHHGTHFDHLSLQASSSDSGASSGQIYDWATGQWERLDLALGSAAVRHPRQVVSPQGHVLVRIKATAYGGDLTISDPFSDLQISGTGAVS